MSGVDLVITTSGGKKATLSTGGRRFATVEFVDEAGAEFLMAFLARLVREARKDR